MSTIETDKREHRLSFKVRGHFNLRVKNRISSLLSPEINALSIDLSACELLDSEAVIFMYRWLKSGNRLEVNDPPDLLFEILNILELRKEWEKIQSKHSNHG